MKQKQKEIDFHQDEETQLNAIKARIGQEVPLSNRFVRGLALFWFKYRLEIWWMTAVTGGHRRRDSCLQ